MSTRNIDNIETEFHRVEGKLYEDIRILGDDGQVLRTIQVPLKVEMKIRDYLEVIVGASILAVPVAFTEEVWNLGEQLPWLNALTLSAVGFSFMAAFVYFSAYRKHLNMFRWEFLKRVFSTYLLSIIVVGALLTIVDKCPWFSEFDVAMKRVLIGAFPASLSATLTDSFS